MNLEKLKNGFNQYFVNVLRTQYADFKGRATRSQYWYFILCYVVVSIPFSIIDRIINAQVFTLVLSLALLVPSIAIGVRRLRDINLSGWFYLIALIPVAGPIALLVLFCMPTDKFKKDNNSSNQKKAA